MKDFDQFLKNHDDKKIAHFQSHISNSSPGHPEYEQLEETWIKKAKNIVVKYGGALGLYLLTGPFNTCSVLMQIADKPLVNEIDKKI